MRRLLRFLGSICLILSLLLAAALLALWLGNWTDWLTGQVTSRTGRQVALGERVEIDWGSTTIFHFRDVHFANREGAKEGEMFGAKALELHVKLWPLLKGYVELPVVRAESPVLLLEKDAEGVANWDLMPDAAPDERGEIPLIGQLWIQGGKIHYRDAASGADVDLKVDSVSGKAGEDSRLRLQGKGLYQRQPFTLDVTGAPALHLRDTEKPYPLKLKASVGNTSAEAEGTVTDPITLQGMDMRLKLKGDDAAELFPLLGIALLPTPPYEVAGHLGYGDGQWRFNPFKGRMGDSDLRGSVVWDTRPERPKLTGQFISEKLDFDDLAGFIGGTPSTDEATSDIQIKKAEKAEASPYLIPDTSLDISRVKAMDAQVEFIGKQVIAPDLPLDDFAMTLTLDNALLKLEPVRFGTATGDIVAKLTINARQEPPPVTLDVRFQKLSLDALTAGVAESLGKDQVASGDVNGRMRLKGTGASLRQMLSHADGDAGLVMEQGRLSNLLLELAGLDIAESLRFFIGGDKPVEIRCMVGDFGVVDGVLKSRAVVMDTTDTRISATGGMAFATEAMDFHLHAEPKDATILSLRTDLDVEGTLREPEVKIQKGPLLARAGGAALLGLIFPPAAILAFVDPGLGEDSPCHALVKQSQQKHR